MKGKSLKIWQQKQQAPAGIVEFIGIEGTRAIISINGTDRKYINQNLIPKDAIPGEMLNLQTTGIQRNYIKDTQSNLPLKDPYYKPSKIEQS